MKRKKTYIYSLIIIFFVMWFFSGFVNIETKNKTIKKITKTNVLYLFGKKNVWSFDKTIEHYNKRGKKTREDWYENKNIRWSYIYHYTDFDSLKKITWLTGSNLSPQKITDYKYDKENRLVERSESSIDKETKTISIYNKDIFYYDSLGRNYKTEMKHIGKKSTGTTTFIEFYTPQNKLNSRIHISFDSSEHITTFKYDKNGHIRTKFGGLTNDSIYYKTNKKGQIIEEYQRKNNYYTNKNKFWFDEKGNKVKTTLDVNNSNRTYKFIFDKNNRLVKELKPWLLFGFIRAGVEFEFDYY